jgi:phage anti-repressor protein
MVSTNKENKMKFLQWITSLFKEYSYQDSLDYFITTKQPKSTAEVEYWTRYYDQHVSVRNYL